MQTIYRLHYVYVPFASCTYRHFRTKVDTFWKQRRMIKGTIVFSPDITNYWGVKNTKEHKSVHVHLAVTLLLHLISCVKILVALLVLKNIKITTHMFCGRKLFQATVTNVMIILLCFMHEVLSPPHQVFIFLLRSTYIRKQQVRNC